MSSSHDEEQPGNRTPSPVGHVALFRGINVGGNRVLPMKDLAKIFADAGATRVRTYIQSGNVVFDAVPDGVAHVVERVGRTVAARFGFEATIVTFARDEFAEALAGNPFVREGSDDGALHVAFLATAPRAERFASLDPSRSPPDRFVLAGRALYLHIPGSFAKTKLTSAYLDSRLETVATVRNWRTCNALLAMLDDAARD